MSANNYNRRDLLKTIGFGAASLTLPPQAFGGWKTSPLKKNLSKNEPVIKTDVLVCGGGPAGIAAAVMAARSGAKTLLVERYGRLGGMAVHARVGPMMGKVNSPFVEEMLNRLGGRRVNYERIDIEYASILQQAGAEFLLHSWAADVLMKGKCVKGARLLSKEGASSVEASVTVDATGDGDIAWMAGAAFEQGRPSDGLMQPMSIIFSIAGADESKALLCDSEQTAHETVVPEGTWEQVVTAGQKKGELPTTIGVIRAYKADIAGKRVINATQINRVDGTKVQDLTKAELEGRKQAYQVLEFLKKHAPGYENAYICNMPAVIGVRETRRFIGTKYLTRDDLVNGRKWPDAVVRSAKFSIDIHDPAGSGQAEGKNAGLQGIAARVKPYDIPYGCLVPRDIDGLLLAGRCISGSHEAHASYRVQCIAMATGAATGAAAAIAAKKNIPARSVNSKEVQTVLGIAI
jgi:hypothetical protein